MSEHTGAFTEEKSVVGWRAERALGTQPRAWGLFPGPGAVLSDPRAELSREAVCVLG